jgi:hypothetical protein
MPWVSWSEIATNSGEWLAGLSRNALVGFFRNDFLTVPCGRAVGYWRPGGRFEAVACGSPAAARDAIC